MKPDLTKPIRASVRLTKAERTKSALMLRIHRSARKSAFTLQDARALIIYRFA